MYNNSNHEILMQRCISLAECGIGFVAPNPMVGAIIVHDGKIIGEGYHRQYGGPHAEINAINSVRNKALLPESTLYVSLEPCSHTGKTPPCADAIINYGIKKVIIGSGDPNPAVNGAGIAKLQNAGIEVLYGVLKEKCDELNKRFFTYQIKKRPYIILKWAQTQDGFIGKNNIPSSNPQPIWITGETEQRLVHRWRAEESSIIVGTNTALSDNPSLTTRKWSGKSPLRMVIDRTLKIPSSYHLFDGSVPTIVFTDNPTHPIVDNTTFVNINFEGDVVQQILKHLYSRNILSLIVEGGAYLLDSFIDENLWDEARVFTSNQSFKEGIKAPSLMSDVLSSQHFSDSVLRIYRNIYLH